MHNPAARYRCGKTNRAEKSSTPEPPAADRPPKGPRPERTRPARTCCRRTQSIPLQIVAARGGWYKIVGVECVKTVGKAQESCFLEFARLMKSSSTSYPQSHPTVAARWRHPMSLTTNSRQQPTAELCSGRVEPGQAGRLRFFHASCDRVGSFATVRGVDFVQSAAAAKVWDAEMTGKLRASGRPRTSDL